MRVMAKILSLMVNVFDSIIQLRWDAYLGEWVTFSIFGSIGILITTALKGGLPSLLLFRSM